MDCKEMKKEFLRIRREKQPYHIKMYKLQKTFSQYYTSKGDLEKALEFVEGAEWELKRAFEEVRDKEDCNPESLLTLLVYFGEFQSFIKNYDYKLQFLPNNIEINIETVDINVDFDNIDQLDDIAQA